MAKRKNTSVQAAAGQSGGTATASSAATATPQAARRAGAEAPQASMTATTGRREGGARRPSQEEIARRAFEIWEARGRPVGQEAQNWAQAERELSARG